MVGCSFLGLVLRPGAFHRNGHHWGCWSLVLVSSPDSSTQWKGRTGDLRTHRFLSLLGSDYFSRRVDTPKHRQARAGRARSAAAPGGTRAAGARANGGPAETDR